MSQQLVCIFMILSSYWLYYTD
ncbi:UNVERIFIED_CONTAM: hypothetical protein GTU68_003791 [Idotea baltica]|nr:hypothetical protein [Idotea baltica]